MVRKAQKRWYIVQTYSGYETAVRDDLLKRKDSLDMTEFIFQIIVPTQKKIEKKADGTEKEVEVKLFPGYVFVEMINTTESWFVVRNTPKVTGFLGSSGGGTSPVPLEQAEVDRILTQAGIITKPTLAHYLGKTITIKTDKWAEGTKGVVVGFDDEEEVLKVDLGGPFKDMTFRISEVEPIKNK